MAEYIEKDKAINTVFEAFADGRSAYIALEAIPAADVVPVRHGRWQITECYPHNVYCSECHKRFAQTHWAVWEDGSLPRDYCPNCGAKMDGEA